MKWRRAVIESPRRLRALVCMVRDHGDRYGLQEGERPVPPHCREVCTSGVHVFGRFLGVTKRLVL
jgi:hypothetical protein